MWVARKWALREVRVIYSSLSIIRVIESMTIRLVGMSDNKFLAY
jgi:hypothetical protein